MALFELESPVFDSIDSLRSIKRHTVRGLRRAVNDIRLGSHMAVYAAADTVNKGLEVVRSFESTGLRYFLIPPRILSFPMEVAMGAQFAITGHVDHALWNLWLLNKGLSWGIPGTFVLVPGTRVQRIFVNVFWYPREYLPIYTYAAVNKISNFADRGLDMWEHLPNFLDEKVEHFGDRVFTTSGQLYMGFRRIVEDVAHNHPGPPVLIEDK